MNLVLTALAAASGERVIIRTGHVPIMVIAGHTRELAREPLSTQAVMKIAKVLLPAPHLQALADIGETKRELPARPGLPREEFEVRVMETDRDLVIEIERYRRPEEDALPEEFFARSSADVAGVSERVASGLRIDAEAVRALADLDFRKQVAVGRVDRVNLGIVAA